VTERLIQRGIIKYLALRGIFAFAVPNGAYLHGTKQQRERIAAAMKRDGMVSGAPDLVLVSKTGGVGFLEVKTDIGRVSGNQKAVHERIAKTGAPIAVVRSVDDVIETLAKWRWA